MNNSNNWTNKHRDRRPPCGGKRRRNDKGKNNNKQRRNTQPKGREKHFQKFVDTDHKESKCWQQNDWNYDNNRNNNYHSKQATTGAGIFPWVRENHFKQLIIPKHINFEQQYDKEYLEQPSSNKEIEAQTRQERINFIPQERVINSIPQERVINSIPQERVINPIPQERVINSIPQERVINSIPQERVINSIPQESDKEMAVSKSKNSSVAYPIATTPTTSYPDQTNFTANIKQEKYVKLNFNKERKSSSSSSSSESSSSESSSSREEPKLKKEILADKPEVTSSKPPSSPLNIKFKANTTSVSSTAIKPTNNLRPVPESSSMSSSSDEESTPSFPVPKSAAEENIKEKLQVKNEVKSNSTKKKNNSEDDVVCIGHLENKIELEDESNNEDVEAENTLNKKSLKMAKEKCMICDKKGHTSFQCQMICKNCSAPYHSYRNCPQPANLNIMLQMFLEFCMQQFQNFNIEKQIAINPCDNVPKPQVNALHLASVNNKSNKLKRKLIKANETNSKTKASSVKRKVSTTKKKAKTDSYNSTDDDNEEDDTDTEPSSTESEDASDSTAESLVSYQKKRKLKSKNATKAALNLSNFSTNPVNFPVVLNGFPNLTVPTAAVQNPANALNLNTLLLTQMFQNAIGSLKK